jgi:hypothetical protein
MRSQLSLRPELLLLNAMMMVRCAAAIVFCGWAGRGLAFCCGFLIQSVSVEGCAGKAGASRLMLAGVLSALVKTGAVSAVASWATSVAAASSLGESEGMVAVRRTLASWCRQLSIDGVAVGMKGGADGQNVNETSKCGRVTLV